MDTLRQDHGLEFSDGRPREAFLPVESPLPMSKQELRGPQRGKDEPKAAPAPIALRRALIFPCTLAMTAAGSYEMYEVVNVGGVTVLEWMGRGVFVLLLRIKDPVHKVDEAPLPSIGSRSAMLLPTYNEDPNRIMARLRAMYESV